MSKPVMVCVGKAGQDVFLQGEVFKPKRENGVYYEHLKLGDKYYVEEATITTGNNAVNAAVTFARQGLPVSLVSTLGDDPAGHTVLKTLDKEHIDTSLITIDAKLQTSFSTILLAPNGERTILDFPGTTSISDGQLSEIPEDASWLYVSSLGSMLLLKKLIKQARQMGVSVAFNPASFELKHIQECADLLEYVTLFAVNKEEAKLFSKETEVKKLATDLSRAVDYVLVSDGPKGSIATDGNKLVEAGMYEDVPVTDRTGAGDAFTSGFVSQIALGRDIEQAITFASANSTSVVQQIGSNTGTLHGHQSIHSMSLKVTSLDDK